MGDWERPLTDGERARIAAAREQAHVLYEGKLTPHRSCGIAIAETFGRPTASYQSLRRGGITGCGECGVIVAGRLVLGELFGDPDPTGPVTEELRAAASEWEARWRGRVDRRRAGDAVICRDLTGQFAEFRSPERHEFCTALATDAAELLAEVIVRNGR
jgi:hypothetical protein